MIEKDSYQILIEKKGLRYLFFFIFGAVILGLAYIFQIYFWPFLVAVILYLAIKPFYDRVATHVKSKSLSSAIIILLLFVLFFVPLFFLLLSIADQAYQLYVYIEHKFAAGLYRDFITSPNVEHLLNVLNLNEKEIASKITEFLQKMSGFIFSSLTAVVSFPLNFIMNFIFMLMMLFVLLKEGHRFADAFYKISPFPDDMEMAIVDRLKHVIRVLLAGNIFIMMSQGFLLGLGLFIAGSQVPVLLGSLGAICSLIPVVGTALIWVPFAVYLAATGMYIWALFISIWSLVCYLLLENFLKPKIFGSRLNFHPMVFFFLLLGSIQSFGMPGIILGPILLTIFHSFWEIYKLLKGLDFSAGGGE